MKRIRALPQLVRMIVVLAAALLPVRLAAGPTLDTKAIDSAAGFSGKMMLGDV